VVEQSTSDREVVALHLEKSTVVPYIDNCKNVGKTKRLVRSEPTLKVLHYRVSS
jgi:hypothetical protein